MEIKNKQCKSCDYYFDMECDSPGNLVGAIRKYKIEYLNHEGKCELYKQKKVYKCPECGLYMDRHNNLTFNNLDEANTDLVGFSYPSTHNSTTCSNPFLYEKILKGDVD